MEFIRIFDPASLVDTFVSLFTALLLGGLIGFERHLTGSSAGLRTNVLVALGAAIFVDIANRYHGIYGGNYGTVHVIAYVVSGVGFLGAGVIMRNEGAIRGLNTAATLWSSAAIGAAAGADLIFEAMMGALFILLANTLLRARFKPGNIAASGDWLVLELETAQSSSTKMLKFAQNTLQGFELAPKDVTLTPSAENQTTLRFRFADNLDASVQNGLQDVLSAHPLSLSVSWSTQAG